MPFHSSLNFFKQKNSKAAAVGWEFFQALKPDYRVDLTVKWGLNPIPAYFGFETFLSFSIALRIGTAPWADYLAEDVRCTSPQ